MLELTDKNARVDVGSPCTRGDRLPCRAASPSDEDAPCPPSCKREEQEHSPSLPTPQQAFSTSIS